MVMGNERFGAGAKSMGCEAGGFTYIVSAMLMNIKVWNESPYSDV